MKRYFIMLIVLLIAGTACSISGNTSASETQEPIIFSTATKSSATSTQDISGSALTQIAQQTLAYQPTRNFQPQGNLIWSDNFGNISSGWYSLNESDRFSDYYSGGYRMWLDVVQYDIWATAGQSFTGSVSVEVDATKIGGTDDNDFGVICNYQDAENFYVGLISSDGYAVIAKYQNQAWSYLSSDSMEPTDAINQGSATNHIRLDCISGELTLYVNGIYVTNAYDDSFSSGDIGLQVGNFDSSGVDIFFDNVEVRIP
ncbi:MAG: hypothetical protein ACK2TS_05465 [Anaerolineales bacterium]